VKHVPKILQKKGCKLILTARSKDKLKLIAKECGENNCLVLDYDLSNFKDLDHLVEQAVNFTGKIDVLLNNVGVSQRSLAHETALEVDEKIIHLNFLSVVALTKKVIPQMTKQGYGQLAVISSISGLFGFPLRTAYAASKHALQGFFESLRPELKEKNIGVTIVSPGRIKTNISLSALTKDGTKHGQMDQGQLQGMPVEKCANQIVRGISNGKKNVLIGGKEILLVYIHRFLPFLYHRIVSKINPK
jgi:short-subunit dehydrogenase